MTFRENEVIEVGPGVFVREAVDNCLWADLGSGAVVVDTLEDPTLADVIAGLVSETVHKPVKWVINTHWDGDHIAGNPTFARAGATVIAHQSCALKTAARDGRPDVTFSDRYVLEGAGRQAEIEWWGGTHTSADSVVFFKWARVLHVADLFGWGLFMQREISEAKLNRTREILDRLVQYHADVVVCGHGPRLTIDHLKRYRSYLDEMVSRVRTLKADGKSAAEIQAATPPPEDMADWWRLNAWKHARNVERLAESL